MSFEVNKIIGAILAAMMLAMVSGLVSNILVHPKTLAKNAYEVAGAAPAASTAPAASEPAGPEPIAPLLAAADPAAGKAKTTQCVACHTFDKGGANRIGPNLYGIVDDEIAHDRGGFAFSQTLAAKGGTWTIDNLNAWLWKPQSFAKDTKMTFVGLAKAQDRADVIAYLNTLSDTPKPLAAPPAAPAASNAPSASGPAAPAAPAAAPAASTALAASKPAGPEPIAPLLAAADPAAGKAKATLCVVCHTVDKGGPNRIGPNLYGIVGDKIASDRGGFAFSQALASKDGTWTIDNLNAWLWNPQSFAKNTTMGFAGLPKPQDRADVIAYLNTLSDTPKPLAAPSAGATPPAQP